MWKFYITQLFLALLCFESDAQLTDKPIQVKSIEISIESDLFTAITTIDIELFNPNRRILDGEFNFSTDIGQYVTGFALDINGFMREGVIVDKQQARVAYENVIRRKIDPGLLEMTSGNNYRVRVYPMPAEGSRKIRIKLSQYLKVFDDSLRYTLPLNIKDKVESAKVKVVAMNSSQLPKAGDGFIEDMTFDPQKDTFILKHKVKDVNGISPIRYSIPMPNKHLVSCSVIDGPNVTFAIHIKPSIPKLELQSLNTITIFWDVSHSSSTRDFTKELEFLKHFLSKRQVNRVRVVTFSNTLHNDKLLPANIHFIKKYVDEYFDGGTNLASIDCSKYESDAYLLFSDGVTNYGDGQIKLNDKPVYCVTSSINSDKIMLSQIAERSGARLIDLTTMSITNAIDESCKIVNKLIKIGSNEKDISKDLNLPVQFTDWLSISATTTNLKDIILTFGDHGKTIQTITIPLTANSHCFTSRENLAALQYCQETNVMLNPTSVKLPVNAKKVVTPVSSFIVLDNLWDYIDNGIEPPSDLQEEYIKNINVIRMREEKRRQDISNSIIVNLTRSATAFNSMIRWWNINEPMINVSDLAKNHNSQNNSISQSNTGKRKNASTDINENPFKGGSMNEVVVVGYSLNRRREFSSALSSIKASELSMMPSMSVTQALAGRAAGVMVTDDVRNGQLHSQISIRGAGSLSGRDPLYIVDGTPVDNDQINSINIHDVESITILKGIQGSIMYGSRGANGVIVVNMKRGNSRSIRSNETVPRYENLDDVDYVADLKMLSRSEMFQKYIEMKDSLGKEPAFYLDAARIFYKAGEKETAIRILSNLAEISSEDHQLLRAMGYVFEEWKMYEEAITVYKKVLSIKEEEPQSYRDLALAYDRKGDQQNAVEILYASLSKDWNQYENRYEGLRSIILNEMNSIISRNKNNIEMSGINPSLIKELPVDLRIIVDWNKDETDIDLHIVEPNGDVCFYSNKSTKNGGRISNDFTSGYGPEEYQVKNAGSGKYKIRVNYFGDNYQKQQVPSFLKLTLIKNFGRQNETRTVQCFVMDGQQGVIEIADIKFEKK